MSRTVSLSLRGSLFAEEMGDVPIFLITVAHESLESPLLFSSDPTSRLSTDPLLYGTLSNGNTYNFLPLTLTLPDDSDGTPPAIKLGLDNVLRDAIPLLRSIATPASVSIDLVMASAPDAVEASWPNFDLVDANYDAGQINVDLQLDALTNEPFPAGAFTPGFFGGLF